MLEKWRISLHPRSVLWYITEGNKIIRYISGCDRSMTASPEMFSKVSSRQRHSNCCLRCCTNMLEPWTAVIQFSGVLTGIRDDIVLSSTSNKSCFPKRWVFSPHPDSYVYHALWLCQPIAYVQSMARVPSLRLTPGIPITARENGPPNVHLSIIEQ